MVYLTNYEFKFFYNEGAVSSDESQDNLVTCNQTAPILADNLIGRLKGNLKCSLASYLDINEIDDRELIPIKVSYQEDKSLAIEWSFPSAECQELSTGVWIRVFEKDTYENNETFFNIPNECLTRQSDAASVVLPSSDQQAHDSECSFNINKLIECRSYIVELALDYDSFRGTFQSSEVIIPPKLSKGTTLGPLMIATANAASMKLNWEDRSGCAAQLSSITLTIYEDDLEASAFISSLEIPRSCIVDNQGNLFSLSLSSENERCSSVDWKPLDRCRKYALEMVSEYSATWKGPPSSFEIFTVQRDQYIPLNTKIVDRRCDSGSYFCDHRCQRNPLTICDGRMNCNDVIDEKYCDSVCRDGLRCGRQCIPPELFCDGEKDCIDGTDESPDCDANEDLLWCKHVTNPEGSFSTRDVNYKTNFLRNSLFLISVKPNNTIWFTYHLHQDNLCSGARNKSRSLIQVYDGPTENHSILISRQVCKEQPYLLSVRSSSNNMLVVYPKNVYPSQATSYYTSMQNDGSSFVPGCGGYIENQGQVTVSSMEQMSVSECVWYLKTSILENTLMLVSDNTRALPYSMTVYDGWSQSDPIIYNYNESSNEMKASIFSLNNRVRVQFRTNSSTSRSERPMATGPQRSWRVSTISPRSCQNHLTESSGTIRSPNYPSFYPASSDCRWNIQVESGFHIRLFFGIFEMQSGHDTLYVYDGASTNSSLIFEKSGEMTSSFMVNSSSNEIVVRFTSDDEVEGPGFLAFYSSVQ